MDLIRPDWEAPPVVAAAATTRTGGVSTGAFAEFNLGAHVGDVPAAVAENRRRLVEALALPGEPAWLAQVHGTRVVEARPGGTPAEADAAVTREPGVVCAVLTADCLPVLLASRGGDEVAAVHAGWRGLADGVISAALEGMRTPPEELLAWLGPAIAQPAFEVGDEVRERFIRRDVINAAFFAPNERHRWQADLTGLARRELEAAGVGVSGGGFCTHDESERFFSYRRDGSCGRQATLVWIRD
ncbi:MAG: peptidoglycan editing factor PgeF [Gammaproteobacteria bacterium]|jgi:YfiH family protein|nr:peptidoglycan editing factor PgeF [Gammaproteobacteria bacterium]